MRDDRVRLSDILEAIERIEKHIGQGRDAFSGDELVQTWVVHHLMIIGEACVDPFRPNSARLTLKTFGHRLPAFAT